MGRKIDLKKIEDVTKCQVTFSKRRSSLIKKANEIAVCCDVDVAFVAFSPSGRVSKYCNKRRIEDVLHRYVDLPPESRLTHMENVQGKMEKLNKLSYIKSDISKLHFLDKRIENLELQIKKCSLELQIVEADLRDYEVAPEQEPASLHQLSWCERNLNHSLEKVMARKMELENQTGLQYSFNFNENELASIIQNDEAGMMKLDPWISPYSANVRESLFQDLVDQTNMATPNLNCAGPSNIANVRESLFQDLVDQTNMATPNLNRAGPSNIAHVRESLFQDLVDQTNIATPNLNCAGPSNIAHVRESLFQDLVDQTNIATPNLNCAGPSNIANVRESLFQDLVDQTNMATPNLNRAGPSNIANVRESLFQDLMDQTNIATPNLNCAGPSNIANVRESLFQDLVDQINIATPNLNCAGPSYIANVRESLFQDLVDQTNIATPNLNCAGPSNMYNFPLPHSFNMLESGFINMTCDAQIPLEQSPMVNPVPKLTDQINVDAWNNFSSVNFPDAAHMTTQTLCDFQAPRFTSTTMITPNACTADMPQFLYNEMIGTSSQFTNSNFNQFNMEEGETVGQLYKNLSNTNAINGSIDVGGSRGVNSSNMQQIQAPSEYLQPEKDFCRDTIFGSSHQETLGQNIPGTSNTQRTGSWEWEDFLFSDNFQFGDSSKH